MEVEHSIAPAERVGGLHGVGDRDECAPAHAALSGEIEAAFQFCDQLRVFGLRHEPLGDGGALQGEGAGGQARTGEEPVDSARRRLAVKSTLHL